MGLVASTSAVARRQYGLVTREQVIDIGLSRSHIQRWLATGRLEPIHPGVYRVGGAPDTWEQRALAAVLGAGPFAVVSHTTAARIWGRHTDCDDIEITVPRPAHPRLRRVTVHRSRDLWMHHTTAASHPCHQTDANGRRSRNGAAGTAG